MSDRDGIQKLGRQHYRVTVELGRGSDGKRKRVQPTIHGSREDAVNVRGELLEARREFERVVKVAGDAGNDDLLRSFVREKSGAEEVDALAWSALSTAEREEAQRVAETGILVGTRKQPLGDYLLSWVAAKRRGGVAERTVERYESIIRGSIIPALGHVRLCDLTDQHLSDYYEASAAEKSDRRRVRTGRVNDDGTPETVPAPLSPTTIHHRHTVLNAALRSAVRKGLIPTNPAERLDDVPHRRRGVLHLIDEAEAWRVLDAVKDSNVETLVLAALYTGARLGELLALRWRDLDLGRQVMHVRRTVVEHMKATPGRDWYDFKEPKSGHGRAVDLDDATTGLLERHKALQAAERLSFGKAWTDLDLVFANTGGLRTVCPGEPIRPTTISRRFRQLTADAGLEGVRFHDLRHAHATMMLRAGVAPHVVSRRLGHSDVAITLRVYADVLPGQERDAAEVFAANLQRVRGAR